ncbi:MAG: hypothetical protein HQM08_29525 [Candidatus Riflebacteria bacterium]|nr:hypothetical protein [Candidatus Riflebacteria bacterium]
MKKSVYLETSVISYLVADPSPDLIIAAHQKITSDWWHHHRHKFDLTISAFVEREISMGNARLVKKRQEIIASVRSITYTPEASQLAKALIKKGPLPETAEVYSAQQNCYAFSQIN